MKDWKNEMIQGVSWYISKLFFSTTFTIDFMFEMMANLSIEQKKQQCNAKH